MPTDDPTSTALLPRALTRWESELVELGGHDDLLDLDPSAPYILDLGVAHPNGLAGFLAGRPTRLTTLFRAEESLRQARSRARAVSLAAQRLQGRYGLPGAQLATGLLEWADAPGGPVRAPVLLRSLTLLARGAGADVDFDLEPGAEARLNPALVRLLRGEGVTVDDSPVVDGDHGLASRRAHDRLDAAIDRAGLGGVRLHERNLIGTFTDLGPGLVAGLRANAGDLAAHRAIRAILQRPSQAAHAAPAAEAEPAARAGEPAGQTPATDPAGLTDSPDSPDSTGLSWQVVAPQPAPSPVGPADLTGARTSARGQLLDAAQRGVLEVVAAGEDVRVEAAPGSGVTATAAAIVAAPLAAGRRLLIVAPGLDELAALDQRLATDVGAEVAQVQRAAHAHARLHTVDPAWGLSRMQVLSRLCDIGADPTGQGARLSLQTLRELAGDRGPATALLAEAGEAGAYTPVAVNSPWAGATLPDAAATQAALDTVRRLVETDLPAARHVMSEVAAAVGLPQGLSLTEWTAHVEVLSSVRGTLDLLLPEVYERANREMVVATASTTWRASNGITMSMLERRRWKRQAGGLVRPGLAAADLHESLMRARLEQDLWARLGGTGSPRPATRLDEAITAVATVRDSFTRLEPVLADSAVGGALADLSFDDVTSRLRTLAAAGADLVHLPTRARVTSELHRLGLSPLITQLRASPTPVPVAEALETAWLRGVLAQLADPPAPPATTATPQIDPRLVTTTTNLGLGRLDPAARYDLTLLLDAHRIGLAEAVLAMSRSRQSVVIGDPAGLPPAGLDLGDQSQPALGRTSVLVATAGRLTTRRLDHVHRQPRALAVQVHGLAAPTAVRPRWSVASARGGELAYVPVPGSTVAIGDSEAVPAREVEAVVALIHEHARTDPDESLAVLTLTRAMAHDVSDVLRQALRRSPELADWLTSRGGEPFVVTDLWHGDDIVREHVALALGLARDPHGRAPQQFGLLDSDAGADLLATALARASRRVSVVSSLTPQDVAGVGSPGAERVAALLASAAGPNPGTGAPDLSDEARSRQGEPSAPVLARLVADLRKRGHTVRVGADPASEPDLTLTLADEPIAVLWDGDPAHGHRHDLAAALERFGWTVRRVRAEDIVASPVQAVAQLCRRV